MLTVAAALSDEIKDLRAQLADAHAKIAALHDDLDESSRSEAGLREELAEAEDFAADMEGKADGLARLVEVVSRLADVHDADRHDGPRRWCNNPVCVAVEAAAGY